MVSTIEDKPDSLLYPLKISLDELIMFELLLEIDALDNQLGEDWKPIVEAIAIPPTDILGDVDIKECQYVLSVWQDAFEWSYYDEVLSAIVQVNAVRAPNRSESETSFEFEKSPRYFHAVFCID